MWRKQETPPSSYKISWGATCSSAIQATNLKTVYLDMFTSITIPCTFFPSAALWLQPWENRKAETNELPTWPTWSEYNNNEISYAPESGVPLRLSVSNHPVWCPHRICLQQHPRRQIQLQLMLDLMSYLWTHTEVPALTAVHAIQLLGLKVASTSGWRTGSPSIVSSLQESLVQSDTIWNRTWWTQKEMHNTSSRARNSLCNSNMKMDKWDWEVSMP